MCFWKMKIGCGDGIGPIGVGRGVYKRMVDQVGYGGSVGSSGSHREWIRYGEDIDLPRVSLHQVAT